MQAMLAPDFVLATHLCNVIVKMYTRLAAQVSDERRVNKFNAECMLIVSSIYQLAHCTDLFISSDTPVNPDFLERMLVCLKVLSERDPAVLRAFTERSRDDLKVGANGCAHFSLLTMSLSISSMSLSLSRSLSKSAKRCGRRLSNSAAAPRADVMCSPTIRSASCSCAHNRSSATSKIASTRL